MQWRRREWKWGGRNRRWGRTRDGAEMGGWRRDIEWEMEQGWEGRKRREAVEQRARPGDRDRMTKSPRKQTPGHMKGRRRQLGGQRDMKPGTGREQQRHRETQGRGGQRHASGPCGRRRGAGGGAGRPSHCLASLCSRWSLGRCWRWGQCLIPTWHLCSAHLQSFRGLCWTPGTQWTPGSCSG